jgi:hypothetical protein
LGEIPESLDGSSALVLFGTGAGGIARGDVMGPFGTILRAHRDRQRHSLASGEAGFTTGEDERLGVNDSSCIVWTA